MDVHFYFIWISLLYIILTLQYVDAIVLRKGPEDKTVYEGDTVTFECIVASVGARKVLWIFGENRFISVGTNVFGYKENNKRCTIINDIAGQYKLKIYNVSVSDDGLFQCCHTKNKLIGNFGSYGRARLTVLKAGTQSPTCGAHTVNPPFLPYQKVTLNCSSATNGFVLKWDNGSDTMSTFIHGKNVIEIVLTPFDNGRVFTCTELNPATFRTQNCSIKPMNILPTVDISPRKPEVFVNKDMKFICNSLGYPSIVKYIWIHDGYVITHGNLYPMKYDLFIDGNTLIIRNVGMSDDQSIVLCHAYVNSEMYSVATTTMTVKDLSVMISTNTPLTLRATMPIPTSIGKVFPEDDEFDHVRIFSFTLPSIIASVIAIGILIIVIGSLVLLIYNRKPKSILDLPDITTTRGRNSGTFIPSVSGGISHNNFIYTELFNEIDFQNIIQADVYVRQSLHEDDINEPLIEKDQPPPNFEISYTSELVAPPLPPKPSRLIAPDLYTEISGEIYEENEHRSQVCSDDLLYCGTELSVRSSNNITECLLPYPEEIYYQIPDRRSLVIQEFEDVCHSKLKNQFLRNRSQCGCDERSRNACPSYARVKKTKSFGVGNLERRIFIPLKCDDLTSAELYDIHTPLLDFKFERKFGLTNYCSDHTLYSIPNEHENIHSRSNSAVMIPTGNVSSRCQFKLRRSKSCPKKNLYEDCDIIHPESFITNLRVAESAPDLVQAKACSNRRHIYETVQDKDVEGLFKAKSDDILSKGSSDISYDEGSSEYMNMEYTDMNPYT